MTVSASVGVTEEMIEVVSEEIPEVVTEDVGEVVTLERELWTVTARGRGAVAVTPAPARALDAADAPSFASCGYD